MQNKRCPEPRAEPCSGPGVQIQARSFGKRTPARCLPGWAAPPAFPKAAFPAPGQQEGALPAGCLLRLPSTRDHSACSTAQGPSHISMDSCHQGWEPGRRRSLFTCIQPLWMQSTVVFSQPCHSEGDFAGSLSSFTLSEGFSPADRAQFWLQAWHLHCWE